MALIAGAVLFVAVPSAALGSAGSFTWATQGGGGSQSTQPDAVSMFSDGASVATGSFNGTATFGSTTLTNAGAANTTDVWIAKANADGTFAWATRVVGQASNSNGGNGVGALPDGSSIITGVFGGTATFGSTSLTAQGGTDAFVAKLNADGTFAWAVRAGSSGGDDGNDVSVLPDGSSIVTGTFSGTATFGSISLTASFVDVFVAKLNPDGTFAWATKAGGSGLDNGYGVSARSDGSSVVTGNFAGTATFGSTSLSATGSGSAVFVAKLNADGTFAWATKAGGDSAAQDTGQAVSVLADGSSVVTGNFTGPASFGSKTLAGTGGLDAFFAKVGADGTFAWATQAGGTGTEIGRSISARSDGSSIAAGYFNGTATFGGTTLTASAGSAFVAGIDPSGTVAWAIAPTGTATLDGRSVSALDDGRSVLASTIALGSATFGATTLTRSSGSYDTVFAGLLSPPVAPLAPTATAGAGEATVTITPVSGSAITSYKVAATSGSHACTVTLPATKCTVTGLTGGTSYTFTVRAVNAAGEGAPSPASNAVTPTAASAKALTATVLPQRARLVSGQQMRVGIRVKHEGTTVASSVVSCMKLPANLVVIKKGSARRSGSTLCFTTKSLAAGKQVTNTVTVRAVATRKVVRSITGSARATGITKVTATPKKVTITPRAARARVTG